MCKVLEWNQPNADSPNVRAVKDISLDEREEWLDAGAFVRFPVSSSFAAAISSS
jgi:hypothetical protein